MQLPAEAPATVFEAPVRAAARLGERARLGVLPETLATDAAVDTANPKKRVAA